MKLPRIWQLAIQTSSFAKKTAPAACGFQNYVDSNSAGYIFHVQHFMKKFLQKLEENRDLVLNFFIGSWFIQWIKILSVHIQGKVTLNLKLIHTG